ncbi:MAG: hypothetical protein OXU61_12665 [Gammaproteobacteria bacterium]|nr:hypothetical protein [Gammaproteobacteria bacterium]
MLSGPGRRRRKRAERLNGCLRNALPGEYRLRLPRPLAAGLPWRWRRGCRASRATPFAIFFAAS